jgi:ectoine hydroxylase-related dioxygenase (phytanoyl-CoA dioxygenase family)
MDDWFSALAAGTDLSPAAAHALDERGFVVLPGPVPALQLERFALAYDAAVTAAASEDVHMGRTTTRVNDFVNRGAEFDALYVFPPLLAAARRVIGRPFKLSALHARTVRPGAAAQELHVDVPRHSADWPLVGFILMVDAFRPDNGATRFVPGSHRWPAAPGETEETSSDRTAAHADEVLACGPAGSLLIFHGSAWHGHSANVSPNPRRSLQGAFIPRTGLAATDFGARMGPDTRARLGPVARDVLAL